MKKTILILFLILTESVLATNISCDTITHWRVFKDSKSIWASNYFDSKRIAIEIPVAEKFSNISFEMFYDFNREILDRKVELVCEGKIIGTLNDRNYSYEKFIIPKSNFIKKSEYLNKEIFIKYIDKINPNGIIIGVIKLKT